MNDIKEEGITWIDCWCVFARNVPLLWWVQLTGVIYLPATWRNIKKKKCISSRDGKDRHSISPYITFYTAWIEQLRTNFNTSHTFNRKKKHFSHHFIYTTYFDMNAVFKNVSVNLKRANWEEILVMSWSRIWKQMEMECWSTVKYRVLCSFCRFRCTTTTTTPLKSYWQNFVCCHS